MKKSIILSTLIMFLLFVSSCATSSVNLGTIGTRNIDYSATYQRGGETSEKRSLAVVFVIPVVVQDISIMDIIDSALEQGGYEFMTETTFSHVIGFFPYLFQYEKYEVRGIGWKKADSSSALNFESIFSPTTYLVSKNESGYKFIEQR